MRKLMRQRPSPAMVVALVALFAAMGGTAIGATIISGSQIKRGSIDASRLKQGTITASRVKRESIDYTRLKKDGLGGVVIKESRLGTVPRASRADDAGTVGGLGVHKLFYKSAVTDTDTELLNVSGLRITARCSATAGGTPVVLATTSVDNSAFRSVLTNGANTPASTQVADFDRTTPPLNVLSGERNAAGTLTYYRPDGGVVTVTFAGEGSPSLGTAAEGGVPCSFAGTATNQG